MTNTTTGTKGLTVKMETALTVLRKNGVLFAGVNDGEIHGSFRRVRAATCKALEARGYCTPHLSPDGDTMWRIVAKAAPFEWCPRCRGKADVRTCPDCSGTGAEVSR